MTTAGAGGDQAILAPYGDSRWGLEVNATLRPVCRFKLQPQTVTDVRIEVGLRATTTAMDDGTDDDKAILRLDTSVVPNWFLVASAGGVDTAEDTGLAGAALTTLFVTLAVDVGNRVMCFIDAGFGSVLRNNPEAHVLDSVNIGVPYMGIEDLAGGGKALDLRGLSRGLRAA